MSAFFFVRSLLFRAPVVDVPAQLQADDPVGLRHEVDVEELGELHDEVERRDVVGLGDADGGLGLPELEDLLLHVGPLGNGDRLGVGHGGIAGARGGRLLADTERRLRVASHEVVEPFLLGDQGVALAPRAVLGPGEARLGIEQLVLLGHLLLHVVVDQLHQLAIERDAGVGGAKGVLGLEDLVVLRLDRLDHVLLPVPQSLARDGVLVHRLVDEEPGAVELQERLGHADRGGGEEAIDGADGGIDVRDGPDDGIVTEGALRER